MKKSVACLLMAALFLLGACFGYAKEGGKEEFRVAAKAAALIEPYSGRILYLQNGDERLPMASTTKIMTALSVLLHGSPEDRVVIDKAVVGVEGSSIYLEAGEEMSVEDLLYGLLLRSGNDAAEALALYAGKGERASFIGTMNEDARALGLENSQFQNPHGLPAAGHYTSAADLAKISAAAFNQPLFRQIVASERHTIPWSTHNFDRAMRNKNKMLGLYEGANGVKTGYTKEAGRCLVSAAERDGMQLIAVVLGCPNWWEESAKLLDYGFAGFEMVEILKGEEPLGTIRVQGSVESIPVLPAEGLSIPLGLDEGAQIALNLDEGLRAPIAKGQALGYARVMAGGEEICRVKLISGEEAFGLLGQLQRGIAELMRAWLS
ncbi:MAG: D-alanyl-D-alanine carboxypeptidase [Christensenellaceae bacterium]|jgi:D-alanyl-D-alanine carboxypeptidase (penicillin-binding protein 5/6)|nr:D-alanyl-D-alanine carboxypeptidase [Christensenellaceae bacterium]